MKNISPEEVEMERYEVTVHTEGRLVTQRFSTLEKARRWRRVEDPYFRWSRIVDLLSGEPLRE